MQQLMALLPTGIVVVVFVAAFFLIHFVLQRRSDAGTSSFRNQTLTIGLSVVGLVALLFALPMHTVTRGQILGFLGILLSATFALSSTTFLGNALAGLMLRSIRNFRGGDFIRVGEHFGRVSERGLFHTELQTEDRELTTLPNLYLATHPVTTIRRSGTVLSATISLGYDVPRATVEKHLVEGAAAAGLSEPFIQILELGDFSVTYRAAGILQEVKQYLTVRSKLRGEILDALHRGGVEIVSPTYMNTRVLDPRSKVIPVAKAATQAAEETSVPEAIVFDKAEEADTVDSLKKELTTLVAALGDLEKELAHADQESKPDLEFRLARLKQHREQIQARITGLEAQEKKED